MNIWKRMKTAVMVCAVAITAIGLLDAVPVDAQTVQTNTYAGTTLGNVNGRVVATNLATGVTCTNNAMVGVKYSSALAVQLNLLGLGLGATNSCLVTLQESNDSSNWLAFATMALTGSASTNASCISNFTVNAGASIRVSTVASTGTGAGGAGTNLNVEVWVNSKPNL
jgi:hypothetical protein